MIRVCPAGTLNVFRVVAQGKGFGSYVLLYGVGLGAVGAVAVCARGRIEECELATSGMAQNRARPLNRKSALSATRAVIGREEFFFIRFVVLKIPRFRPISGAGLLRELLPYY